MIQRENGRLQLAKRPFSIIAMRVNDSDVRRFGIQSRKTQPQLQPASLKCGKGHARPNGCGAPRSGHLDSQLHRRSAFLVLCDAAAP